MQPARIKKLIGFSKQQLKRIDRQAKQEGRNRSEFIRRAVERYLDTEEMKRA